jgi:hypothetical protein
MKVLGKYYKSVTLCHQVLLGPERRESGVYKCSRKDLKLLMNQIKN